MRRVLFLAEELRVGGAETYFYKIENNISRDKIEFFSAAVNGEQIVKIRSRGNFVEFKKSFFSKVNVISRIIKTRNIDVVHANSLRLAIISSLIKRFSKLNFNIIYTKHNITILEKMSNRLFAKFVNKRIDRIITVCNTDKDEMIKKGVNDCKIIVIANGTDINQFRFNPRYINNDMKEVNIGILARLSEEKNHHLFIDIINQLQNETNIKAFIAGDGALKDELMEYAKEKNVQIKFLGNVSEPQKFLEKMDINLIVSKREVFPMAIIEGMAVGTIIISVDVGGIKDAIINEKTGYLIESYNVNDYAMTIKNIIYDKEKNIQIIKNSRNFVENNYDLKVMLNKIENLYLGD